MNEYEAQRQGYSYIGPLLSSSGRYRERDVEAWEANKVKAKQIKKEYEGADYVIATGTAGGWLSTGSKAIFGNDTFAKVWHAVVYGPTYEDAIRNANKAKERARLDYETALANIEVDIKRAEETNRWLNSIKKVK